MWNKMGGQGLLLSIGSKVLVTMTLLQNIVIPNVAGIKIFNKDDQVAKYCQIT